MKEPCNITLTVRVSRADSLLFAEMADQIEAERGTRPGTSETMRRIVREWAAYRSQGGPPQGDPLYEALSELARAVRAGMAAPEDPYHGRMVGEWLERINLLQQEKARLGEVAP